MESGDKGTQASKEWGLEKWIVNDRDCGVCLKEMSLHTGHQVSLHRHKDKSEVFVVKEGMMIIELETGVVNKDVGLRAAGMACYEKVELEVEPTRIETRLYLLTPGLKIAIAKGSWHRMYSVGADACEFLEVSTFHSDEDTERWPGEGSR